MLRAGLVVICLAVGACGGSSSPSAQAPATVGECSIRLAPRQANSESPAAPPTRTAPVSQIVVHLQQELAPLTALLEGRVQKQLAEGKFRIGPGGTVTYNAVRGALTLSVSRTAFVVETPVHARAEACRGESCYASCAPEAIVRAEVPLQLGADYGFAPARVSLRFTRGCKVRALGGLLTIDVTPTLEGELEPQLQSVARQIDRQLPNLRAEVEKSWPQLTAPRELPIGGCFVLQPQGIVQGPIEPSTERLQASFALLAVPELRLSCGATPAAAPLPPLRSDPALPAQGVVHLGMVTALSNIARGFEATPGKLQERTVRVAQAEVSARGSDLAAQLTLAGDVCGAVALDASLDFRGDGQFIRLTREHWPLGESERLANSELSPAGLATALAQLPRLAPLLSVSAFRAAAPMLAAALSRPPLSLSANVSSARAAGAAARGDELVAWLEARGSLLVTQDARATPR